VAAAEVGRRAHWVVVGCLKKPGEILGVALIDHVIIGGETRFTSLRRRGSM